MVAPVVSGRTQPEQPRRSDARNRKPRRLPVQLQLDASRSEDRNHNGKEAASNKCENEFKLSPMKRETRIPVATEQTNEMPNETSDPNCNCGLNLNCDHGQNDERSLKPRGKDTHDGCTGCRPQQLELEPEPKPQAVQERSRPVEFKQAEQSSRCGTSPHQSPIDHERLHEPRPSERMEREQVRWPPLSGRRDPSVACCYIENPPKSTRQASFLKKLPINHNSNSHSNPQNQPSTGSKIIEGEGQSNDEATNLKSRPPPIGASVSWLLVLVALTGCRAAPGAVAYQLSNNLMASNLAPKFVPSGSSSSFGHQQSTNGNSNSEIVVRVKEGQQSIGKLIYTLRGEDPDDDPLTFGVLGSLASELLRIENVPRNQANVYLRKELDRETTDSYQLIITLTDGKLGRGNWITKSMLIIVSN